MARRAATSAFIADGRRVSLELAVHSMLEAIGEDPSREGLIETPSRVARFWREFTTIDVPARAEKTFSTTHVDQLVVVSGVEIWSMCEHHLLPFWCDLTIAYLASDQLIGLSKLVRIAKRRAARLQIQERLGQEIAQGVINATDSSDVAVIARGRHLCMMMRGVKSDATTTTSAMYGRFRDEMSLRTELVNLVQPLKPPI